MKVRSLVLGLMLSALFCLPPLFLHPSARAADTNDEPAAVAAPSIVTVTNTVDSPDLQELRTKLDALQRANDLALGRWSALLDQNNALSNVLTGLQNTLDSERRRETELADQARSFNAKVMFGAGAAIFLVFLASYWFQLRCLNRVMEIARTTPELPAPFAPALLEAANTRESKLLEAIQLLEDRIRHLEAPVVETHATAAPTAIAASPAALSAANGAENGHSIAAEKIIATNAASAAEPPLATKISVLLAKGEVLLETERLQEAVNSFNEALAYEPNNAEAHLKKGIALERLNRLELALSSYNEALRLNPKRSFAYVHKARVLAALHRYDEALSVYDMALGKNGGKNAMNGGAAELSRATAQS
jgi:tetratricopeptide (TPR) repeat protein